MSWTLDGVSAADLAASGLAVALDTSVRAALLLGAAGAFSLLARRAPARWRHGLWLSAFAGLAALPVLAVADVGPAALARTGGVPELALAAVWIAGVAVLSIRHAVACRRLRAHLADATPGPRVLDARVLIGGGLSSPVTFGIRPVVLLPADFMSWSATSQRQVLLHEGAHVARRDWLTQRAATVLCHLFWFHPIVWIARRLLVLEAERAADEAVLRAGERPSDYARLLLDRSSVHSPVPALAAPRWLELRIRSLLGPDPGSRWPAAVGVALLLLLTPALSTVQAAPDPPEPHCQPTGVATADAPGSP